MKKIITLICILIYTNIYSQTTLPYSQDFEGTFLPAEWEFFGSSGATWQQSTTVGGFGTSSNSAFFDNFNTTSGFYGMRCIAFDLTTAINPTLQVDVAYARYDATRSDRFGIWRSFNGTTGWSNIMNYSNASLTTAPDQTTYFTPTNAQWQTITLDLTAFAGVSYVRFAFENNCDNGNTLYIDNILFYDASPLAVNQENIVQFNLFPNPTTDKITLNTNIELTVKNIQIHNTLGQELDSFIVTKINTNSYELNLESFSKGVYYISVKSENKITTKMIVVK